MNPFFAQIRSFWNWNLNFHSSLQFKGQIRCFYDVNFHFIIIAFWGQKRSLSKFSFLFQFGAKYSLHHNLNYHYYCFLGPNKSFLIIWIFIFIAVKGPIRPLLWYKFSFYYYILRTKGLYWQFRFRFGHNRPSSEFELPFLIAIWGQVRSLS